MATFTWWVVDLDTVGTTDFVREHIAESGQVSRLEENLRDGMQRCFALSEEDNPWRVLVVPCPDDGDNHFVLTRHRQQQLATGRPPALRELILRLPSSDAAEAHTMLAKMDRAEALRNARLLTASWFAVDLKRKAAGAINLRVMDWGQLQQLEAWRAIGITVKPEPLTQEANPLEVRVVELQEMQVEGAPGYWTSGDQTEHLPPEHAVKPVVVQQRRDEVNGKRPWRLVVRLPWNAPLLPRLVDQQGTSDLQGAGTMGQHMADLVNASQGLVKKPKLESTL